MKEKMIVSLSLVNFAWNILIVEVVIKKIILLFKQSDIPDDGR